MSPGDRDRPGPLFRLRRRLARVLPLHLLRQAALGSIPWWLALRGLWPARGFRLRHLSDCEIFHEVVVSDAYHLRRRLPGRSFAEEDVVLDVGAHVGTFGFLCHLLGSRRVVSYEAQGGNFAQLLRNYRSLAGARAVHAAVFRSDRGVPLLTLSREVSGTNSGSGSVLFGGKGLAWEVALASFGAAARERVPALPLDEVLAPYPRVRLLKLDCEGSEFPILLSSELLPRVEEIVGEYHEVPPELFGRLDEAARLPGFSSYRFADLAHRLEALGYAVRSHPSAPCMGLFWARNRGVADKPPYGGPG